MYNISKLGLENYLYLSQYSVEHFSLFFVKISDSTFTICINIYLFYYL